MKNYTTIVIAICTLLAIGCKDQPSKTIELESENQTTLNTQELTISEEKSAQNPDLKAKIETATEKKEKKRNQNEEPMNVLDAQAKIYTDVFANLGGVEELQGIENFKDLIEKADATPETKKQLTEQYNLYSNSIDPEKKEAVKAQLSAMLLEAMKQ